MICDYLKWIVDPEYVNANVFTFLSVIVSGLISWGISASYFRKGNRDNLKSSVLHPMRRLLDGTCSREKYKELLDLSKEYGSKYLSKKERVIVDELLGAYKSVYAYQYDWVCAESLFSYFKHKLKKQGIDPEPAPIYDDDGEIVDVDVPGDMVYMRDDLAKAIEQYPPGYDTENCQNAVKVLFKHYAKSCYGAEQVVFFDDLSITEVLKKARNRSEWNNKLDAYEKAKSKFLEMDTLK